MYGNSPERRILQDTPRDITHQVKWGTHNTAHTNKQPVKTKFTEEHWTIGYYLYWDFVH